MVTGLSNDDFVDFPAPTLHEMLDEAVVEADQEIGDEVVVGRVQLQKYKSRRNIYSGFDIYRTCVLCVIDFVFCARQRDKA